MKLLGADPRAAIEGKEELSGKSHYFIGNEQKKWQRDVPQYARVEYQDVYPGVAGGLDRAVFDLRYEPQSGQQRDAPHHGKSAVPG